MEKSREREETDGKNDTSARRNGESGKRKEEIGPSHLG
jgi:hypothetical protein